MADETTWKRRFYLYMGTRVFGLLVFFAGLAIVFTDLLREGGWPLVGVIIMLMGLADAIVAPKLMKKQWEREDSAS
jgi:hypothetical protein